MNYRFLLCMGLFLLCFNGLLAQSQDLKEVSITANYQDQALAEVLVDLENRYNLYF